MGTGFESSGGQIVTYVLDNDPIEVQGLLARSMVLGRVPLNRFIWANLAIAHTLLLMAIRSSRWPGYPPHGDICEQKRQGTQISPG